MASCDLVIGGARVIDGSGGASRFVDVSVDRDRSVDLGDCRHWQATTTIDAGRIIDRASFAEPKQLCEGIVGVRVNGAPAWQEQAATGLRRGRFVTH